MNIKEKIQILKQYSNLFANNLIGIEKEGLRVSDSGDISQTSHPKVFGCALTHPHITTDFSEALIELVTPPMNSATKVLNFLSDTQHYLYSYLPQGQNFWTASMPCIVRGKTNIPIAQYGSSNLGKMKTIYRLGLANRYGSVMQTIAGIHFNYSFSQDFWQIYQKLMKVDGKEQDFIDSNYMSLVRNCLRYGWIISYLFGTSVAVCKSFLRNYHKHNLIEFNSNTLYLPYATSLRMGDIGYQNSQEDNVGVKVNYNSLCHYVNSLQAAIKTSCADYEAIGIKKDGVYKQLNTNILQIENEYYASIRPKPIATAHEKPVDTLAKKGISYIELRSIDINPLIPLGIDIEQIYFLEVFLLFCLLDNSAVFATHEQLAIDNNNYLVAHFGRSVDLVLTCGREKILLKNWALKLSIKIKLCAKLLSIEHQKAVSNIFKCISNPELTPSAIMLNLMRENNQGFFDFANSLSKKHRQTFLAKKINHKHFYYLKNQAQKSFDAQKNIEDSDNISFDKFLANYFAS